MKSEPPRVFISYTWESDEHMGWVRFLATELLKAGVDARLDQWFLKPGDSWFSSLENEVESADRILIICTPEYAKRSNRSLSGVASQEPIISDELVSRVPRSKFLTIWRNGSYHGDDSAIPTHFSHAA